MPPGDESEVSFEPDRIIETLVEHHVKFVLVGGSAAQFHGAQRLTKDADVVVEYGRENLERLSTALDELNWRLRAEGISDDEALAIRANMRMHPDIFEHSIIHTLMTDAGAIDILRMIPDAGGEHPGRDYTALNAAAITHQVVPGLTVKLASLEHIIESKQWSNRPKDREALPELLELQAQEHPPAEPDTGCGL